MLLQACMMAAADGARADVLAGHVSLAAPPLGASAATAGHHDPLLSHTLT
jgi:hypothetical protein